jgi:hypothetical protein
MKVVLESFGFVQDTSSDFYNTQKKYYGSKTSCFILVKEVHINHPEYWYVSIITSNIHIKHKIDSPYECLENEFTFKNVDEQILKIILTSLI